MWPENTDSKLTLKGQFTQITKNTYDHIWWPEIGPKNDWFSKWLLINFRSINLSIICFRCSPPCGINTWYHVPDKSRAGVRRHFCIFSPSSLKYTVQSSLVWWRKDAGFVLFNLKRNYGGVSESDLETAEKQTQQCSDVPQLLLALIHIHRGKQGRKMSEWTGWRTHRWRWRSHCEPRSWWRGGCGSVTSREPSRLHRTHRTTVPDSKSEFWQFYSSSDRRKDRIWLFELRRHLTSLI